MTTDELLALVKNQEDNFIERKQEGVTPGELRQTVCAFANSVPEGRNAVLFVGIHDRSGDVIGVGNPDQLQKRIRDACHFDCYPAINYSVEVLTLGDKHVVAVIIPASNTRPHFTGPAYTRVGSQSLKASPAQYEELILSRNDKARGILMHKDEVFTVIGNGYKTGSNKALGDNNYRERRECRVDECTGQFVTLRDIGTDQIFSEPLENVVINYDHERHRPMLIVSFPKG